MYHLAKVIHLFRSDGKTISSDASVQALVETWDEHIFTVIVHPSLNEAIKKSDFVLMHQTYPTQTTLDHTIVKIIAKKLGEESWKTYKEYFSNKRKLNRRQPPLNFEIPASEKPITGGMIR